MNKTQAEENNFIVFVAIYYFWRDQFKARFQHIYDFVCTTLIKKKLKNIFHNLEPCRELYTDDHSKFKTVSIPQAMNKSKSLKKRLSTFQSEMLSCLKTFIEANSKLIGKLIRMRRISFQYELLISHFSSLPLRQPQ